MLISEIVDTLSADISKVDLKEFIAYAQNAYELPVSQEYGFYNVGFTRDLTNFPRFLDAS